MTTIMLTHNNLGIINNNYIYKMIKSFSQYNRLITSPYIGVVCIIVFTIITGIIIKYCKRRSPIAPYIMPESSELV